MKLILIRHGMTPGNEEKRYIGSTDQPLSQKGKEELLKAKTAGVYPAAEGIFVSPMKRCCQTACLIYKTHKPVEVKDLRECDFGAFENKNYLELSGDPDYEKWMESNGTLPFPGGEDLQQFKRRTRNAFEEILRQCKEKQFETVAIVAHGGTIMSVLEAYVYPHQDYYDYMCKNADGYVCTWDGQFPITLNNKEKLMHGKLYGVGVGPGDPELMTLKAVKIAQQCPVIAVPGKVKEETVSYKIAASVVRDIEKKQCLNIYMPMTKDAKELEESHAKAAEAIMDVLNQGLDVAFLTLGDPTVYSTYIYIHQRVKAQGYETEIINGIPSFCAVAATLNEGLVEKAESLHVIPSSYGVEEALELDGTKVLMKAGKKMPAVKEALKKKRAEVSMIENCGMENEKIYHGAEEIPDHAGYYSLIIVKEDES